MPALKSTIVFMLKAPVAGQVKTRLASQIGEEKALAAYRALVEHLLKSLAGWRRMEIHYAPATAEDLMIGWLGKKYAYYPQVEGNLGTRLHAASSGAFDREAEAVVLLGGDCPYVNESLLETASAALTDHDVAIGPATDGGYYLLAIKQPAPELFQGINWSTGSVYEETLQLIRSNRLQAKVLPTLEDVDDLDGWLRAEAFLVKVRSQNDEI